jgi:hypothetical protein
MSLCSRSRTIWPLVCALGLCLTAGRAVTAEPASAADDLKAIRTILERIEGRQAAQQSQLTDTMVSVNKLMSDVATIKDEHARLKQELMDLRNRLSTQSQSNTSYFAGSAPGAAPPPGMTAPPPGMTAPPSARVRLINSYFTEMAAVINGVTYILLPGTERTLSLPPGNLQYQVMMVADFPQTRTLAPGEQLTLTLYPRR